MANNKKRNIPQELEGVAKIEDVSVLEERVDRCYSAERYEEFQAAVEKIALRYLKSTLGWFGIVWLVTLVGSMLLQKYHPFF